MIIYRADIAHIQCEKVSRKRNEQRWRFVNKHGVTDNKRFTVYYSATPRTFEETVKLSLWPSAI